MPSSVWSMLSSVLWSTVSKAADMSRRRRMPTFPWSIARRIIIVILIRPVEFSEWAAPIVPVLKDSGDIRIRGDYKVTINQAVKVDKYIVPNIDDGPVRRYKYLTLDLSNAYQQVVLDEESHKLTTINTTKGLSECVRLPYGISSAPGVYQRSMEQLLQNIPMTVVYLDDIIVSGSTPEQTASSSMCVFRTVSRPRLAYISGVWNSCYRTFLWRLCTSMPFLCQDQLQKSTTETCEQCSHIFSTMAYGCDKRNVFSGRSLANTMSHHIWRRHPSNTRQGHPERTCAT